MVPTHGRCLRNVGWSSMKSERLEFCLKDMEGEQWADFPEDHSVQAFKPPVAESHILLPFSVVVSTLHLWSLPWS